MATKARDPGPDRGSGDAPAEPPWTKRLTAELFGTFALVFVAARADTMASVSGGEVVPSARAVAPALMVAALIYAIGDCSGAHFNPAVSLAFTLKGLLPARWLAPYWGAQLLGSVLAAAFLWALFGDAARAGISRPHVADGTALAIECVLSWLLIVVVLGTADRYRVVGPDAALAVGATIALCGLIALPIEGASMNPARSLGPALIAGDLSDYLIYLAGPFAGASLATLLMRYLHGTRADDGKAEEAARGSRS
jgi:MIP family channel proteins